MQKSLLGTPVVPLEELDSAAPDLGRQRFFNAAVGHIEHIIAADHAQQCESKVEKTLEASEQTSFRPH